MTVESVITRQWMNICCLHHHVRWYEATHNHTFLHSNKKFVTVTVCTHTYMQHKREDVHTHTHITIKHTHSSMCNSHIRIYNHIHAKYCVYSRDLHTQHKDLGGVCNSRITRDTTSNTYTCTKQKLKMIDQIRSKQILKSYRQIYVQRYVHLHVKRYIPLSL